MGKTIYINERAASAIEADSFGLGFEPGGDGFGHIVQEDVDPDDVDLSSFKVKDRLHPKFWKDSRLDSRIRNRLLDITDDFIEYLGINWAKSEDILMTGSLANYNWSEKFSDIDVHVVMDYESIDERPDLVDKFLAARVKSWNTEHEDLTICGFPIEFYVQDTDEDMKSGGIYSLERDKWIKEPQEDDLSDESINKRWVQRKSAKYMDRIDGLADALKHCKDRHEMEEIGKKADKVFADIKQERAQGFEKGGGEMNDQNIVFKTMRRAGYLGKITDISKVVYNKINSI